ncbi:vasculin-like protein 1 [Nannospalax galili]|uniref:vasculin-like protein 1 n=1 Tax=Nannospalax galili TaxID=1026970 RepID=UPI000819CA0A|nr:vasculin-like protein 1 [Nannospalax galili]
MSILLTVFAQSPSSTTPPIKISSSRLTKLTHRTTDRKSEFLKTLKDDHNGHLSENRDSDKLEDLEDNATPEPKEKGENCLQNGLSVPIMEEGEVLSHSLEAEHRLLKEMGWQEYPENDESCLPLTEDELKEFHMKTEQDNRMRPQVINIGEEKIRPPRNHKSVEPCWTVECRRIMKDCIPVPGFLFGQPQLSMTKQFSSSMRVLNGGNTFVDHSEPI